MAVRLGTSTKYYSTSYRIYNSMDKNKKLSLYLLLTSVTLLVVTQAIGNLYASAAATVFGLAVLAANITDMLGSFLRKKRS